MASWHNLKTGAAFFAAFVLQACAPGAAADALRPEAPSAQQALGEEEAPACDEKVAYRTPLVVDLPSQARTDLEVAMGDGIAVVNYGCEGLKLLADCRLEGDYGYAGVTLKEEVIELSGKDELRVNLPIAAVSLGAGMERGSSLALALAIVGKRRTVVTSVARAQLSGECEGATHFVRASTVGAFAMKRQSHASVSAAVSVFGAGTETDSQSDKSHALRDGSLAACRAATRDSLTPPAQCDAALRLELRPLGVAGANGSDARVPAAEEDPCPTGFVLSEGKCAREGGNVAHLCDPNDEAECGAQCNAGSADSCYNMALIVDKTPTQDTAAVKAVYAKSTAYLERACRGGNTSGCFYLGMRYEAGGLVGGRDLVRATEYYQQACYGGDGMSCGHLASRLDGGRDGWYDAQAAAFRYYRRGCELGIKHACFSVISKYIKGQGTPKSVDKAFAILKRTCLAGEGKRCAEMALLKLDTRVGPTDVPGAIHYLEKSCALGRMDGCRFLAKTLSDGAHLPADLPRAKPYAEKGCAGEAGERDFCKDLLDRVK